MSDRDEAEVKPRILHLEDDPADRELIREALGAEGIPLELVQVDRKAEFEAALASGSVALVLSDFALPHFDGFSALDIVQKEKPNLPFIFVSGTMGEEAAIESLRRGATDYVLKERLSRLGPAVRRALEDVAVRQTRLEAAEAAANRQRFMNAMLDSLDAGIMACDAAGVLTMFNRAARDMVGLAETAIPPEQWAQHYNLYHPDGKRLFEKEALPLYRALCGEKVRDVEVLIRRRDGHARMVLASGQPILGIHGQTLGAVIALHDITERKLLEDQLRQSQKLEAVGSLAGGVAHDFNNLLTVIGGYSQMILQQMSRDDPKYVSVEEISKASERAAALTRQLLAFSRQQVLEPKVLDLNKIVSDMERMLHRLLPANIEFVTSLSKELGRIKADPGQVEQVLLNLVVNARDAMAEGGRLIVETANIDVDETYRQTHAEVSAGPYVVLTVSDSGSGMSAETQARIFEPFFTTKEVGKGTGLGLSTVYGIVNQSGGAVGVHSEIGSGSAFRVYLPRIESTPVAERRQDGTPAHARGTETILIVEDDARVRELVQRVLEAVGYTVLSAADGQEALDILKERPGRIHLVVTDIVMPRMSGPELLSRIRQEHPGCKGLYMSGYSDKALFPGQFPRSEAAHLQKPFSPGALAMRVREVLEAPVAASSGTRSGTAGPQAS
ncbi:MAG: response regulator [Candidatus Eisenbacteria bacterium]|uniref:histidine kinase n=1 Tax=Eiseniibacteriota bacterium TaxID=2212470 RepID=A0A538TRQ3_UNCEI|nr:MAG: response regulator [Candidatus Eisenbacteria bacterium]